MHLSVNLRRPVARTCELDYVVPILIDVLETSESDNVESLESPIEYIVGRLLVERLDWRDAEMDGIGALTVCDAISSTWLEVFETITRRNRKGFRRDLGLEEPIDEVYFIHEILIHPEIVDRVAIVDACFRSVTSNDSIFLTHYQRDRENRLSDIEFRDLGFRKIAKSDLLIKDNHFRYPFGEAFGRGRDVEFSATEAHENWLLEHWEGLLADQEWL